MLNFEKRGGRVMLNIELSWSGLISTHDNEVSATIITEDEADENNDLDFSVALNKASVIMKNITTKMHDKENHYNQIFNEGQSQLEIIGEQLDNLSIING